MTFKNESTAANNDVRVVFEPEPAANLPESFHLGNVLVVDGGEIRHQGAATGQTFSAFMAAEMAHIRNSVETQAATIASLQNQVTTTGSSLQNQVGSLQNQVGSLQNQVGSLQNQVGVLEGDNEDLRGKVLNLQKQVDVHEETIAGHEETIAGHEETIGTHEETIAGHEETIAGHEGTIGTHEETIAGHEEIIGTLEGGMKDFHVVVQKLEHRVEILDEREDFWNTSLWEAGGQSATQKDVIEDLLSRVEDLTIDQGYIAMLREGFDRAMCPVCTKQLRDVSHYPCGHSMCSDCSTEEEHNSRCRICTNAVVERFPHR